MSAKLILLASYPKSGNTWLRIVLQNLLRGREVAINELAPDFYGYSRRILFDDMAPVNASDLTADEIDALMPGVLRQLAHEASRPVPIKLHDMARKTRGGEWMFPPDCVKAVLHLVRHPFDVIVSYAAHMGLSVDAAIDTFGTDNEIVSRPDTRLRGPLPVTIGSWSQNVVSWMSGAPYPVTTLRYEDLHRDPLAGFTALVKAAGIVASSSQIARAVEASRFDRLRQDESRNGFRERPASSKAFFRSGRPRSWEGVLDAGQISRIASRHSTVMEKLGYRDDGTADAKIRLNSEPFG